MMPDTATIRVYADSRKLSVCTCGQDIAWYQTLKGNRVRLRASAHPLVLERDTASPRMIAEFRAIENHWLRCPIAQAHQRRRVDPPEVNP